MNITQKYKRYLSETQNETYEISHPKNIYRSRKNKNIKLGDFYFYGYSIEEFLEESYAGMLDYIYTKYIKREMKKDDSIIRINKSYLENIYIDKNGYLLFEFQIELDTEKHSGKGLSTVFFKVSEQDIKEEIDIKKTYAYSVPDTYTVNYGKYDNYLRGTLALPSFDYKTLFSK